MSQGSVGQPGVPYAAVPYTIFSPAGSRLCGKRFAF